MAGTVHGVRYWHVLWGEREIRLGGQAATPWEIGGEATVARCKPPGRYASVPPRCKRSPTVRCDCGLYGLHPHGDAPPLLPHFSRDWPRSWFQIAGVIEAWGRLQLHKDGFRAQFARPVALVIPTACGSQHLRELAASLAEIYCVPLKKERSLASWLRGCRTRGWGLDPRVVADLLKPDASKEG